MKSIVARFFYDSFIWNAIVRTRENNKNNITRLYAIIVSIVINDNKTGV